MEEAPEDRPVLLVNEKGDMAVAKWNSYKAGTYGGRRVDMGYWQLTGCALGFDDPIAWAECPRGPND